LQKAIRRGDTELAVRALVNLSLHDPRSVWRHLAIIAAEDIGVANADLISKLISTRQASRGRAEWPMATPLVAEMSQSLHCQAACDLLLRLENDPSLERDRLSAADSPNDRLASLLYDEGRPLLTRALAAMSLAGVLGQRAAGPDPHAVFDILSDLSGGTRIAELGRSLWRMSRSPMSLFLPLLWPEWNRASPCGVVNDQMLPSEIIAEVPDYALDQFTRAGRRAIKIVSADREFAHLRTKVPPAEFSKVVGDVLSSSKAGSCDDE